MALHAKAKAEPGYRFYALYDKISREDILAHAYAQCRSNKGAPGVDRQDFEAVEAYGVERWLGELALALRQETYRPDPTSNSRGQSVVSATAARCAPDDWPPIYRRLGSPPKLAALRQTQAIAPTHLLGHREQAPAGVRDTGEVGDDVVRASADEHLGRRGIALGVAAKPRPPWMKTKIGAFDLAVRKRSSCWCETHFGHCL